MQLISYLASYFAQVTVDDAPKLHALDTAAISEIAWYKRLEMAVSLGNQVKALHESGRVHRLISVKEIFYNDEGQWVLGKSTKEAFDCDVGNRVEMVAAGVDYIAPERAQFTYKGSFKPDDVFALGSVFYKLFFNEVPPCKRGDKPSVEVLTKEAEGRQNLLNDLDFLSDDDAVKSLLFWMCNPDVSKRADSSQVCHWLKKIKESDLPLLSDYFPKRLSHLPKRKLPQDVLEIVQCVESLFIDCPESGPHYIHRRNSHLNESIIYLKDRIILLPKKSPDADSINGGSDKIGRDVTVLEREKSGWQMRSLFALTSKRSKTTYLFKSAARKERHLHAIFKEKGILAKQVVTLGYAHKPDKILCIYEKGMELFSYISRSNNETDNRLELLPKLIHAVDVFTKEGIFHRDLKLENVLLGPNNCIWLCDIDYAVRNATWQDVADKRGTVEYVPPERYNLLFTGNWEPQDVYAVGCIILQMVTLRMLLWDKNLCEHSAKIIYQNKLNFESKANKAKTILKNSEKLSQIDPIKLAKYLASWMTHPNHTERATWKEVLDITCVLKKKLGAM